MKLYLVRHGDSLPESADPQKGLSEGGRDDVRLVANAIRNLNIQVEEIWHSDKLRARQTAEILVPAIVAKKGLIERLGLAPNDLVDKVYQEITARRQALMLVGHMPFLGKLATLLMCGEGDVCHINFASAGMAFLEHDGESWSLNWLIEPGLLRKAAAGTFQSYH